MPAALFVRGGSLHRADSPSFMLDRTGCRATGATWLVLTGIQMVGPTPALGRRSALSRAPIVRKAGDSLKLYLDARRRPVAARR